MQKRGGVGEQGMFNTFNMGIGMMLAVDPAEADLALQTLRESGEKAYQIGRIVKSEEETPGVIL